MRNEIRIFFTALMFYTRIPCPKWVDHSAENLNRATRYFPLIGWIVGGVSAFTYLLFLYFTDVYTALLFSLAASVLTTGAFHEDGFADVCDGFGGGWTKERILTIMKDSRVGTYGVVGIILLFAAKISLLAQYILLPEVENYIILIILIFISAHTLSRFTAATFIFTHSYVREDELSKAKPIAKESNSINLFIGLVFTLIPLSFLSWFTQNYWLLLAVLPVYIVKIFLGRYFKKWIGGYTGDCLGATQQVAEITYYLSILILWKFTW